MVSTLGFHLFFCFFSKYYGWMMISIALLILVLESLARTKSAVATNITRRQAWEDVVACPGVLELD